MPELTAEQQEVFTAADKIIAKLAGVVLDSVERISLVKKHKGVEYRVMREADYQVLRRVVENREGETQ